jgi:UDP-GlcNAc:undecaprenyl-phosphate GlcNAc-1-phosphate transferase
MGVTIPVYFVAGSLWIENVPFDFGVTAIVIAAFLLVSMIERAEQKKFYLLRLAVYVTAAMLIFLVDQSLSMHDEEDVYFTIEIGYFIMLSFSIALIIRWAKDVKFTTTPTDYLMVFLVIAFGVVAKSTIEEHGLGAILIKAIIFFYGCEVIINRGSKIWNGVMRYAVLLTLSIIGIRGLLMG